MRIAALAFLIGVIIFQQLSLLPALAWSGLLLVLVPVAWLIPRWRLWLCIGMGFLWVNNMAHHLSANVFGPVLEGQDMVVEGLIASMPETLKHGVQFQFEPDLLHRDGVRRLLQGKLLLSWSGVRLWAIVDAGTPETPHNYMNLRDFDFEDWLIW